MAQTLRLKNLQTLKTCQLCIICAKSREAVTLAEQYSLVTTISSDLVDGIPQGHDFYVGTFGPTSNSIPYYVTSTSRQGIQTFGIEAATLFAVLKPKYAIHVGVCAAISGQNITIEDVIFGERALNYEEGNWALKDNKLLFRPDVKVAEVKGAIMDGFIARKEQPLYKYGDFVSGCAVRMDAAFILDRVKNTTLRNVAALDMESSAFLQACEYTGVKALGVIKGVADMGDIDQGKSHDRHYTALIRAAEAAKSFIKYKNIATEAVDRSGEPGALITHGYFDNFIARIMEKLEYAEYKVSAGNESISNSSTEIKVEGLRIVLPEELNKKPEEGNVDFNIASFNANDGGLARLVRKHGLQEVTLKGPPRQTNIHLKGPYLVDLPTTLAASLANVPGKDRQVNLFQKTLADKVKRYGDFVRVINWEEFVKL